MIKREYLIIAFLGSCLFAALLVGIAASVNVYNPLADVDCDGDVDVGDQRKQQLAMFTFGNPINLTVLDALKPIAMGYINSDGSIAKGYNLDWCRWNATYERYEIKITGVSYYFNKFVTHVTGELYLDPRFGTVGSVTGMLLISMYDTSGNEVQSGFQFVTYEIPTL